MRLLFVCGLLALLLIPSARADVAFNCQAPCTIVVSVSDKFPGVDQQIIREVLADFSVSPELDLVEGNGGKIRMVLGADGFYTTWNIAGGVLKSARVSIDRAWVGGVWCCDSHDGIRGVYCVELMHAIGNTSYEQRLSPSCMNGTSPYLGPEDRAAISSLYPLGG